MSEMTTPTRPFSAAAFNQYLAEGKLMAARCTQCGALYLPPRAICPACYQDGMEWVETSGRARLAAFTVIYVPPNAMAAQGFGRQKPYISGIVELEEGLKISVRIEGLDPLAPQSIQTGALLAVDFSEASADPTKPVTLTFRRCMPAAL